MATRTSALRLPAQLAATAMVVFGLGGVAHVASTAADAAVFDRAAAETRSQLEGMGRGVGARSAHVLEGRWRVDYEDPWFAGRVVYDLREEDGTVRGYLVETTDETGRSFPGDSLVFELRGWDGTSGKGLYSMDFEGERYQASCAIELQSADRLRVRYDFHGYRGDEIWVRMEGGDP